MSGTKAFHSSIVGRAMSTAIIKVEPMAKKAKSKTLKRPFIHVPLSGYEWKCLAGSPASVPTRVQTLLGVRGLATSVCKFCNVTCYDRAIRRLEMRRQHDYNNT